MVMKPEPIAAALEANRAEGERVVYLTPAGRPYSQRTAEDLSRQGGVTLLCGRYEGVDQRIGAVRAVWDGGRSQLLEVAAPDGKTHLVPFLEHFIREVDLSKGRIALREAEIVR